MGSHNKPISQALEEVNNLCKSIFHIPTRNRAKHFSPYIARSLAVLSEQKEERAFCFRAELPESTKGGLPMKKVLTVTFDSCKPLHTAPSSAPFCGEIVCADIGIRDEWHPAGLAQL